MLSDRLKVAQTPWQRIVGFLDSKTIEEDQAIWFDRCANVHTLGMRARIDIIFLDAGQRVLALERNVAANRANISHALASSVLELGTSTMARIKVGDLLSFDRG
ncbi:MAG: DUF192 domain-containing protein [Candidatus Eremiobacteraeota bacterium]|nr:DUF192 domain-containing protein [Candidatus Eremiobacteraeota bacterium]